MLTLSVPKEGVKVLVSIFFFSNYSFAAGVKERFSENSFKSIRLILFPIPDLLIAVGSNSKFNFSSVISFLAIVFSLFLLSLFVMVLLVISVILTFAITSPIFTSSSSLKNTFSNTPSCSE